MLEHALYLASLGFAIVPLHEALPDASLAQGARCSCGSVPCKSKPGKHPRTAHGLKDATTDPAIITHWWTTWPNANIAIVTGQASSAAVGGASLVVIDVDGEEAAAALGQMPATLTVSTGKGWHLYFAGPHGLKNTQGHLAKHVDTRAENGYVIAPPSVHMTGRVYAWLAWQAPAQLPAEITARLLAPKNTTQVQAPAPSTTPAEPLRQNAPALNSSPTDVDSATSSRSLDEWTWSIMTALPGTKHETLRDAAYAHACHAHERAEAREAAQARVSQVLLQALASNSSSQVENWSQAEQTVSSAFDRAYARAGILLAHEKEFSEDGLARRFAKLYGSVVRHVPGQGWYQWDGRRWAAQPGHGAPTELVSHMLTELYNGLVVRGTTGDSGAAKLADAIKSKKTSGTMRSILALAQRYALSAFDAFDRDPYLLTCQNGTIDLRTGALGPFEPSHLITRCCAVAYDPSRVCSGWLESLHLWQRNDASAVEYLRVLFGSFLFGRAIDGFWILHGNGFDGKTTVLEVLTGVLGDYAGASSPRSILVSRSGAQQHTSALGSLVGKRLVVIDELPAESQLDTGAIKQHFGRMVQHNQTGMGKDFVSAAPTAKGLIATNHLPRIDEHDHGTRRRFALIPFDADLRALGVRKDDTFATRLLAQEGASILAWLVGGFMRWCGAQGGQAYELPYCERIELATSELFEDGDMLGGFLSTCSFGPALECTASELYNAYKRHGEETGDYVMSKRAFGNRLRERKLVPHKGTRGMRMYIGIRPPTSLAGVPPSAATGTFGR